MQEAVHLHFQRYLKLGPICVWKTSKGKTKKKKKNQRVKTTEKVASQISGEDPSTVPEGHERGSSYFPEIKGFGSERGQVWDIRHMLPVGGC